MNKPVLTSLLLLAGIAGNAHSAPIEVFNANTQCNSRMTSTGLAYVPPCQFSSRQQDADSNDSYSYNPMIQSALFKTKLTYDFVCDSIRPLTFNYRLRGNAQAEINGRLAASRTSEKANLELTHDKNVASLLIDNMQGATGFQAIKPNCRLTIDKLVTYPEPAYFNLLASTIAQYNNELKALVRLTSTSTDYALVINSISSAISTMEMLQFDNDDELLLQFLTASIDQLKSSRDTLSNQCGSGSQSSYCQAEIARLRSHLSSSISSNESNIRALVTYLEAQTSWLSSYTLGRDEQVLRQAYSKLKSLL